MAIVFSIEEALKTAARIEQNASTFYRRAAALQSTQSVKDLLYELAAMEDRHLETFSLMRTELSEAEKEPTTYDPMDEEMLYLKALADMHGGEGSPAAAQALTGKETLEEILRWAIELEQKTVAFYIGLRDKVPAALGRDKMDRIISEEKKHVVQLSRVLNTVRERSG